MKSQVSAATLLDRPNRFLGLVNLDGEVVEAFIPNPGRMHELMVKGAAVFLRENPGPHRKTRYDPAAKVDSPYVSVSDRHR